MWDNGSFGVGLDTFVGGAGTGMPLVLYDNNLTTAIIAPITNFMVAVQTKTDLFSKEFHCGLTGMLDSIPANYTHSTVFYAGSGINTTMTEWGSAMLQFHGKTAAPNDVDIPSTYLGYWTDHGAYYYYLTLPNATYQDTMISLHDHHVAMGYPVRYYQLDSWWYPKDENGAVTEWTPMESVFPGGMEALVESIGLPLVLHNRYWSKNTNYSDEFSFTIDGNYSLPADPDFFTYLIGQAREWGLVTYEQDWLNFEYLNMNVTQTSVSASSNWLHYINDGAASNQVGVQFCMPLPSEVLMTVELGNVWQIRASDDYLPGNLQWQLGPMSLLQWSLGMRPFKDNFWTSTNQTGNPYNLTEPNPELQTLVALLTTGPVGFSDKINETNKDLLMNTCSLDGTLLKPDKPATPIDANFLPVSAGGFLNMGFVWSTFSTLFVTDVYNATAAASMPLRWFFVLDIALQVDRDLTTGDLELPADFNGLIYNYNNTGGVTTFSPQSPYPLARGNITSVRVDPSHGAEYAVDYTYLLVAPELPGSGGWYILGEQNKFARVSQQRFGSVATGCQGSSCMLEVMVEGSEDEQILIDFVSPMSTWSSTSEPTIITVTCNIGATNYFALAQCMSDSSGVFCKCGAP